jgi:hypothetical protein
MLTTVLLTCPTTERPVSTDLVARATAWAALTLAARTLWCSACHQSHRWTKADVWLQPGDPDTPTDHEPLSHR